MIWVDDTFPYNNYKGKGQIFETVSTEKYVDADDDYARITWHIDYAQDLGLYRITKFKNNHWHGDLVFEEPHNAFCPICNEKRWIPDINGYCCKCGHHLSRMEKTNGINE